MSDGRPAYVEALAAIRTATRVLLLGMPSLTWATAEQFDIAPGPTPADTVAYLERLRSNTGFAGFLLDSLSIAKPVPPPFRNVMRRVVSVRGLRDTIHVVWTAPSPDSAYDAPDHFLWHAEFQEGHWTRPELLFQAQRLDWAGARPSVLVRGGDIYVFTAYNDRSTAGIAFIRRIAGRWRTTKSIVFGLPSEASAQFVGGDSIAVAYVGIGALDARVPNGSHVYVLRLSRTDSLLPRAQRVQWSGLDAVHWPHIYRSTASNESTGQLVLLWARWPKGRGGADAVLTLLSDDNGNTWSPLAVLSLPVTATWLTQAQDRLGEIHIVAGRQHAGAAKSQHPYFAMLRGSTWTELAELPIEQLLGEPTLFSIQADSLLLAWSEGRPRDRRDTASARAPITRYAWSTQACPQSAR